MNTVPYYLLHIYLKVHHSLFYILLTSTFVHFSFCLKLNYLSPFPRTWADQQIGLTLTLTTNISNHIFSSFSTIKHTSTSALDNSPPNIDYEDSDFDYDDDDWKYHDLSWHGSRMNTMVSTPWIDGRQRDLGVSLPAQGVAFVVPT